MWEATGTLEVNDTTYFNPEISIDTLHQVYEKWMYVWIDIDSLIMIMKLLRVHTSKDQEITLIRVRLIEASSHESVQQNV